MPLNPRKRKKEKIIEHVLTSILGNIDLALEWAESPYAFKRKYFSARLPEEEWKEIMYIVRQRQVIARLREKDWLKAREEGNEIIYKLHHDAIVVVLREKIRRENRKLPKGSVCIAVFDFPVGANKARTQWRRFLRSAGFSQKQLSVWVSDKDVGKDLRALVNILDAGRRVAIYTAREK